MAGRRELLLYITIALQMLALALPGDHDTTSNHHEYDNDLSDGLSSPLLLHQNSKPSNLLPYAYAQYAEHDSDKVGRSVDDALSTNSRHARQEEDFTAPERIRDYGNGVLGIVTGAGTLSVKEILRGSTNFIPPHVRTGVRDVLGSILGSSLETPHNWWQVTPATTKGTTPAKYVVIVGEEETAEQATPVSSVPVNIVNSENTTQVTQAPVHAVATTAAAPFPAVPIVNVVSSSASNITVPSSSTEVNDTNSTAIAEDNDAEEEDDESDEDEDDLRRSLGTLNRLIRLL